MKTIYFTIIVMISFFTSIKAQSSFKLTLETGIENPYFYEYDVNFVPSIQVKRQQDFRFFRTSIHKIGIIYDLPLGKKERWSLSAGANLGWMHQFIADTIFSPYPGGHAYNLRLNAISIEPNFNVNFRFYKELSLSAGINGFLPFSRILSSDMGNYRIPQGEEEKFYPPTFYLNLGLFYQFERFKIGLKLEDAGGDVSELWIRDIVHSRSGPLHYLQRWMISSTINL